MTQEPEERYYGVHVMHRAGPEMPWMVDHEGVLSFQTLADEVFSWIPEARTKNASSWKAVQKWLDERGRFSLAIETEFRRIEFNLLVKATKA